MRRGSLFRLSFIFLSGFSLIIGVSGCGLFDAIEETKGEVKQTNTNMQKLIAQGEAMAKRTERLITQGENVAGKLQESVDGVNGSLEEVQKSNAKMETLVGQGEAMAERTEKLIEQGKELSGKMDRSVAGVEGSLEEVQKSNAKMETLVGQGKDMAERTETLIEQGQDLSKKMEASLEEVKKTRKATESLLDAMNQQKPIVLRETLNSLAEIIHEPFAYENHYRIASAKMIFKIFLEQNLDADWYRAFFAANLKMCKFRATNPYGEVCTDRFAGSGGKVANWYERLRERLEEYANEKGGFVGDVVTRLIEIADRWTGHVPLTPLAVNMVWALSLDEEIIPRLNQNLATDPKDPQTGKVKSFFRFAQTILLSTLDVMTQQEEEGAPLETFKLQAYLERKTIIQAINRLPDSYNDEIEFKLNSFIERLVNAASHRELTPQDQELLNAIQQPFPPRTKISSNTR